MIKRILTWNECDSSVCDKVFASFLWSNIRFPVGIISEDVAVAYRVIDCANKIVMVDKPMYNYFHRSGSITTSASSAKNMQVIVIADEIFEYIKRFHPDILSEARYFKFTTLLHWNRLFALQTEISTEEKYLYRTSRKWLLKHFFFVLFSFNHIRFKDKMWYILIVLGMKKIIRKKLEQSRQKSIV